tara:strand:+ start:52106 stop:52492 length:387 start_codon:yes stop_codon:yes gene_type:complete
VVFKNSTSGKKAFRRSKGQAVVEYVILTAFVGIAFVWAIAPMLTEDYRMSWYAYYSIPLSIPVELAVYDGRPDEPLSFTDMSNWLGTNEAGYDRWAGNRGGGRHGTHTPGGGGHNDGGGGGKKPRRRR